MKISARNVFEATVSSVKEGPISAELELTLASGDKIVAGLTEGSVKSMGLKVGSKAVAIVKAPLVSLLADAQGWTFSARNQLAGTVAAVQKGSVNASVSIQLKGGARITSIVTLSAVDELGLAVGSPVTALFKAGAVIIGLKA